MIRRSPKPGCATASTSIQKTPRCWPSPQSSSRRVATPIAPPTTIEPRSPLSLLATPQPNSPLNSASPNRWRASPPPPSLKTSPRCSAHLTRPRRHNRISPATTALTPWPRRRTHSNVVLSYMANPANRATQPAASSTPANLPREPSNNAPPAGPPTQQEVFGPYVPYVPPTQTVAAQSAEASDIQPTARYVPNTETTQINSSHTNISRSRQQVPQPASYSYGQQYPQPRTMPRIGLSKPASLPVAPVPIPAPSPAPTTTPPSADTPPSAPPAPTLPPLNYPPDVLTARYVPTPPQRSVLHAIDTASLPRSAQCALHTEYRDAQHIKSSHLSGSHQQVPQPAS